MKETAMASETTCTVCGHLVDTPQHELGCAGVVTAPERPSAEPATWTEIFELRRAWAEEHARYQTAVDEIMTLRSALENIHLGPSAEDPYARFMRERLDAGDDPNQIADGIEQALDTLSDWVLWGDGRRRPNTVCPDCGSPCAGICGHDQTPIPYSEYEARQGVEHG